MRVEKEYSEAFVNEEKFERGLLSWEDKNERRQRQLLNDVETRWSVDGESSGSKRVSEIIGGREVERE